MKKCIRYAALLLFSVMLCSTVAQAQGIKERMKARAPQIRALKSQHALGENNKGFLKAFKPSGNAIAGAENNDRKRVYAAIAKQQGASPSFVGERRAAQIRGKAKAGDLLQGQDGKWYKK